MDSQTIRSFNVFIFMLTTMYVRSMMYTKSLESNIIRAYGQLQRTKASLTTYEPKTIELPITAAPVFAFTYVYPVHVPRSSKHHPCRKNDCILRKSILRHPR